MVVAGPTGAFQGLDVGGQGAGTHHLGVGDVLDPQAVHIHQESGDGHLTGTFYWHVPGGPAGPDARRTLSPHSFAMSSMSEVNRTTGRRCRSAISATTASMAYLWPCSPALISM